MVKTRRLFRRSAVLAAVFALAAVGTACGSQDPYNLHAAAQKLERAIMGASILQVQTEADRGQYVLYEGIPMTGGGIMYRPFYVSPITISPEVGNAVFGRKRRFGEVFGLLARGAVGEGAGGRLVARVGPGELTKEEKSLIEAENDDRLVIADAFRKALAVPTAELPAIHSIMAYARYQELPRGVWVEREPGRWVLKGGAGFRQEVMTRQPVRMEPLPEEPVELEPSPSPPSRILEEPSPTVREPVELMEPTPAIRAAPPAPVEEPPMTESVPESRSEPEEEPVLIEPVPEIRE